jgi:putative flavoprotein involved in K+ transport
VLVVGSAQSGTQIMAELAEAGRKVYLSVGSRSLRLPRQVYGRDFSWWMRRAGLFDQRYEDLTQDGPGPPGAVKRPSRFPV